METLGQWLEDRCKRDRLSLRQAAAKTGLSHVTIAEIMKGGSASAETIRKLAQGFSSDGQQRLALEDRLLVLAGHRTERPDEELSEPLAQLMDKAKQFSEPQIKMMLHFADFLTEIEGRN
ncbi:hypothetical protein ES705_03332 [subsurface metagenome]